MSLEKCIKANYELLKSGTASPADIASYTLGNQIEIMKALEEIQSDLRRVKKSYPAPGFGPG